MSDKSKLATTLPSGAPHASPAAPNERTDLPTVELQSRATVDETLSVLGDTLSLDPMEDAADAVTSDQPGYVVAHRYRLAQLIGRGAHGRVWEADDLLTGGRVALKMLSPDCGTTSARIRREVASMRLLRLSGVVQLLDEGTDGDRPFLVMERVHGTPFPGQPGPASWPRIAKPAIALLETLARMHAVGIVHRDLKPANVLVDADGRPIILDFGLARVDTSVDEGITDHGSILGTPAYLSPEQVESKPVTARSDLYAIGVMLFEALSGRFPHPHENVMRMLQARVHDPPTPLGAVAPDVPRPIADLIDALLATDPTARPRSAGEALDRLRGRRVAARPALRRLGSDAPLSALVDAALAGASMDVHGPRGSGRSRCLHDVAAELGKRGRAVLHVAPSAISEDPTSWELGTRAAIAAGSVLLVDDADRLAPASAAAVARLRETGSVIRAFAGAPSAGASTIVLAALSEIDLRALFTGADRLFHLPEDAARVLHRRTDGMPARVADDVTGWIQARIARWDGDRVVIDRDAIERLEAGLLITPPDVLPAPAVPLPPALEDLLGWIVLAHPHAHAAHLAVARGTTTDALDAELRSLEIFGAVRRLPDGRVEPRAAPGVAEGWAGERPREVHRRIAFAAPPGTPRRLYHLITGADDDIELGPEIAAEARHLARRLAVEGRLPLAAAAVGEGLRAERRLGMSGAVESLPLLTLLVEIALEDGTPRLLDRAIYELYRIRPRTPAIEKLARLVRAALAISQRTERALEEATAIGPFADPTLERRRQEVRVAASRIRPQAEQESLLSELSNWAERSNDPAALRAHTGFLGRLRYRQGRFVEAAELNARAAIDEPWVTAKLAGLLRSASCQMEAFELDAAAAVARDVLDHARRYRLPFHEASAERILRSVAYRTGAATAPDLELLEAARNLGVGEWEAMLTLNEAAVARRAGDVSLARDLAQRAVRAWAAIGEVSSGALLASALAVACGAEASPNEISMSVERALESPAPRLGVQTLGLLALARRTPPFESARLEALLAKIPTAIWDYRLEVLSIREALDAIKGCTPPPSP
ncbi:serine/threonine protein kinase [Minicystis rosea]|nr:serine/threonine protein kinase [Minicystis rosea]